MRRMLLLSINKTQESLLLNLNQVPSSSHLLRCLRWRQQLSRERWQVKAKWAWVTLDQREL